MAADRVASQVGPQLIVDPLYGMQEAQSNTMQNDLGPPQSLAEDAIYKAIKITLAAIPGVGGAAAEIFAAVFAQPIQKRRDEWYEVVSQTLRRLQEEHGVPVDRLRDNPVFIDCVLQATQRRRAAELLPRSSRRSSPIR